MIRILIASGAHKHVLNARQACEAISKGISQAIPDVETTILPMADGGEGTVDSLVHAHGGEIISVTVTDPLSRPTQAVFGIYLDKDGVKTAVIEIAQAAGSGLLKPYERQTMVATSYGVGELLLHARDRECKKIVVGLGGSIVSDMGIGMAQALGFVFLNNQGQQITPVPGGRLNSLCLDQVADINFPSKEHLLSGIEIVVASDAAIPLLGLNGQASIFGPQKAATPSQIAYLEQGFANLASVLRREKGINIDQKYAGAAGGLGAGLVGFLGAKLFPGAEFVSEAVGLKRLMNTHDWIITGEGLHDPSTWLDKTPYYVAKLARNLGKPVAALVGAITEGTAYDCYNQIISCNNHVLGTEIDATGAIENLQKKSAIMGALLIKESKREVNVST